MNAFGGVPTEYTEPAEEVRYNHEIHERHETGRPLPWLENSMKLSPHFVYLVYFVVPHPPSSECSVHSVGNPPVVAGMNIQRRFAHSALDAGGGGE